jgi:hypothetical protein
MLAFVSPGRWRIPAWKGAFAVRVHRRPAAWELQDAQGRLTFGDGFESLAHLRAWLKEAA